jgi:elongation factor G
VLFVNKIDKARGTLDELLEALQPLSAATLVARAMPISKDEEIVGFVDLALDRAFRFRPGKASERIALPAELEKEEQSARFHLLEQLADHDDYLLEQLLNEEEPDRETVFSDLRRETADGVVVPMMFGSAANGHGVRRLLKALRHDTPAADMTARRLGLERPAVEVFKIASDSSVGRLALGRVFGAALAEGAELNSSSGQTTRAGALFGAHGAGTVRMKRAEPGDIVGIAKADMVLAGGTAGRRRRAQAAEAAAGPRGELRAGCFRSGPQGRSPPVHRAHPADGRGSGAFVGSRQGDQGHAAARDQ